MQNLVSGRPLVWLCLYLNLIHKGMVPRALATLVGLATEVDAEGVMGRERQSRSDQNNKLASI